MSFDDFIDAFNLIDRIEGLLYRGRFGSAHTFKIRREGDLTGEDIERILKKRHVTVFERRVTSKHFIFSVKRNKQAIWAEYNLCRVRAMLDGRLLEPRNPEWAAKYNGQAPPAWDDQPRKKRRRR